MTVLVTGGAGYIGSHVVRLLERRGIPVLVVDDLSTGRRERAGAGVFADIDLAQSGADDALTELMRAHSVDAVVHFAAKKQVGESVERPLWYFQQNIGGLANLLSAVERSGVDRFVFSSSAAVYGIPDVAEVREDTWCAPINPYGQTKLAGEWMVDNATAAYGLKAVKLRYFNVAGAGWPDLADSATMNLIPIVLDRLERGLRPLVFGDDYPTPDGTCIRDYIHVRDLAEAHIAALELLTDAEAGSSVFNVGTGTGASVREVIDTIAAELGEEIAPEVVDRRAGDPPQLVAEVSKIERDLKWSARLGLKDIVQSALRGRRSV